MLNLNSKRTPDAVALRHWEHWFKGTSRSTTGASGGQREGAASPTSQALPPKRPSGDPAPDRAQRHGERTTKSGENQRLSLIAGAAPQLGQYRLEFDDGSSVVILGRGFIGREPTPPPGALVQHLVRVPDGTLSLSRTHLEFDLGESGLWVRDCGSTNGSEILINGRRTALVPGVQVATPSGCTIYMGARRLKVTATAGRAVIGGATVDWGVATRIGARRNVNQDAYCTQAPAFVVADGMGGHAAGAIASREAVDAVAALSGQTGVTGEMLETCLADASARINQIPVDHGRPPGTTLSGVIVTHADKVPIWMVVNIGDSRTYRVNSDGIRQISIDHSVVQKMINAGAITASAAASLPYRNLLTRALRGDEHRADTWRLPMRTDDRILICSDGLTREIGDAHIARVLRNIAEPLAAADELVNAAGDAGGHDDATALVIDVVAIRQV